MRLIVHIFGYPPEADIKKMRVARPRVAKPRAPRGFHNVRRCCILFRLVDFAEHIVLFTESSLF